MQELKEKSFWQHGMAKFGLFMAVLFSLWFGGWFLFANYVDGKIGEGIQQAEAGGLKIGCENRDVTGFPFRIGVDCDRTFLTTNRDVFRLEAGALKTAAQLYAPGRMVAELESPFRTWAGTQQIEGNWDAMRLFADVSFSGGFDLISLTSKALTLIASGNSVAFADGGIHLRPTPDENANLDIALNARNLTASSPGLPALPPLDAVIDTKLTDGYQQLVLGRKPLRQLLREGVDAEIRSAILTMAGDGKLAVAGPLSLHEDGTVSGTIRIGIANPEAVSAWFEQINPQLAAMVGNLAQAVNGMGSPTKFGTQDIPSIEVTVTRGEAKLGFITLGKIPPFFQN